MAAQDLQTIDNAASPAPLTPGGTTVANLFRTSPGLLRSPALMRALPALATVSGVGIAALAWWVFQTPPMQPLFSGLNDGDKGAVAEALTGTGINYQINRDSGAIEVAEDQLHQARMMLASQGLPKAAPAGDALIAGLPMGSSRAVEGETLRGARQADLARTIEAIDLVRSARVLLAVADPSPFVRDDSPPAASVMLTLESGRSLSEAQVRAIRHLVASSVAGMQPERVSVVDQSGALISQAGSGDGERLELQIKTEERLRQAVTSLLTPIVGHGNFSAEVHADIDVSESQSTRESYPKDDRALRSEEGNRTSTATGSETGAVGIPGTLSNQPPSPSQVTASRPAPAQPAAPAQAQDSNETFSRTFDVGREISVTHNPQGRLKRVSVAVALRDAGGKKGRSAAEILAVENLVKGAVGFDAARGDAVVVSSRPFAVTETVEESFWDKPWFMTLLRQVGALIAAILAFFFIGRPLMRKLKSVPAAAFANPAQQTGTQALPAREPVTLDMIEQAPSYVARADLVRSFTRQDPDRAAMVVQRLMQEPGNGR
jgi:flagellar M-ring protein FliF